MAIITHALPQEPCPEGHKIDLLLESRLLINRSTQFAYS